MRSTSMMKIASPKARFQAWEIHNIKPINSRPITSRRISFLTRARKKGFPRSKIESSSRSNSCFSKNERSIVDNWNSNSAAQN